MSHRLSNEIREAIASIDAHPHPTAEQLMVIRQTHRAFLTQMLDFADDLERQRRASQRAIPVWGEAGAASRLYRWLQLGQRRPQEEAGGLKIVGGYAS